MNMVISEQIKKREAEACALVNKSCEPFVLNALNASPVFESYPYVDFGGPADNLMEMHAINFLNEQFYKDLCTKVGVVGPADRIILPTINQYLILGAYWWVKEQVRQNIPVDIIFIVTPTPPIGENNIGPTEEFFTNAFRLWEKAGSNVRFWTMGQTLTDEYKRLGCHRVETIPIPVHLTNYREEKDAEFNRDITTFVFAGDARGEKGSALFPGACKRVSDTGRRFRLIIQSMENAPKNLKSAIEAKQKDIEVRGSFLFGDDFLDFLRSGDVTIMPYNPASYANRASHILIESLTVGRPVITCKGTWMARELETCVPGSGFTINFSEASLADSMIQAIDQVEEIRKTASHISREIRKKHGADRFGEFLLGD
ncbi:MAG: glycosyltransferase [Proteobacteria bacterium]|nr:glycosyltransferase [Pseudomonadota bacterium]